MRVICTQDPIPLHPAEGTAFSLFQSPRRDGVGSIAATMVQHISRAGMQPPSHAWDFLAVALSVAAADRCCLRSSSPDGWTREIQLEVAVTDPMLWETQSSALEAALRFLTGDIWQLSFAPGGTCPPRKSPKARRQPLGDCVCLLSGGVDSFVGAIDAFASGRRPVLVSQKAKGDSERQKQFARTIESNLSHLQLSHAIKPVGEAERSERARSMVFIAYAVLASSILPQHSRCETVEILVPENGFISLNIPFTPLRIGSLSTRTTHPFFIRQIQNILNALGFSVRLLNEYQFKTKGEMLSRCSDQHLLRQLVFGATSCGRFARFNYRHCGRCVPCLVRRAAFLRWGVEDKTVYEFEDLSIPDHKHRDFDDVRSVAFAIHSVAQSSVHAWAGATLNSVQLGDIAPYAGLAERGIAELRAFLEKVDAI